ncbi:competence type IV pilus minor pilin ComGF [Staphylococcus felis]|uniref:competence type IV pilus minor pilin ComGF n=1 Tax=Staphylococcus felis TaxID=46127 RepID=UPI003966D497
MKFILKKIRYAFKIIITKIRFVTITNGFTLIESIFALFIHSLIVILIPILIYTLQNYKSFIIDDNTYTIELMAKEVASQIHSANFITIPPKQNEITVKINTEFITFKEKNFKLIKTVNNKGNITVLNQVKHISYKKLPHKHVIMSFKYLEGEKWYDKEILF